MAEKQQYLGIQIDESRNNLFSDTAKYLVKQHYSRDGETLQQALARPSVCWSSNPEHAQRLYDYASQGWFMYASPVFSNAVLPGEKPKSLPISCYLPAIFDSVPDLLFQKAEYALLSVMGGGVGQDWSNVRPVSKKAPGPIPFIHENDAGILAWRQGGTRRGALAAYLDIQHPDTQEFLKIRTPTGDSDRKSLNIHHGYNISDSFMEAVERGDEIYSLINPATGKEEGTINPRQHFIDTIDIRGRTGEPFMYFVDTANKHLPEPQKMLGLKSHATNLCFTGDTVVAIADGRNGLTIKQLAEESQGINKFPVYSARLSRGGKKYYKADIKNAVAFKTGIKPVVTVTLSNGNTFRCTEDHILFTKDCREVKAKDSVGETLSTFYTSTPNGNSAYRHINSVTNGYAKQARLIYEFYNGPIPEGHHIDHIIDLIDGGDDRISNLQCLTRDDHFVKTSEKRKGEENPIHRCDKQFAKIQKTAQMTAERNHKFSGYTNRQLVDITRETMKNTGLDFYSAYKTLIESKGFPKSFSKYRFGGSRTVMKEIVLGLREFDPKWDEQKLDLIHKQHEEKKIPESLVVISVINNGDVEDVYDLTVDDNHNFYIITSGDENYYNSIGVLVHNCTEITLPASKDRTPVCCLSSLNAEKLPEYEHIIDQVVSDLIEMLDNVITFFVDNVENVADNYTDELDKNLIKMILTKVKKAAKSERSLGLGVMGWHYLLQSKNIPYESQEAINLNVSLFERIKNAAHKASCRLGKEKGVPPDIQDYIKLCEEKGIEVDPYWVNRRNLHLLSQAPNSNNATILDTTASTETAFANLYSQEMRIGSITIKNRYLEKVLEKYGKNSKETWDKIADDGGSVKNLDFLTDRERAVFKTAMEIDQYWVVEQYATRQPNICQAQSMNLYMGPATDINYAVGVHIYAWKRGLKSIYYYRTETGAKVERVSTKVEQDRLEEDKRTIVYGTPTCTQCKAAKALLEANGIEYEYVDLVEIGKTAAEVVGRPVRSVPQVVILGQYVGGLNELMTYLNQKKESDAGDCLACEA